MKSLRKHKSLLAMLLVLFFAPAALAVVTVLDPGGSPVPNQTISITLPSGEVKEGETDDDGILFWLVDGKRTRVDELPAGTVLGGGYSYAVKTGLSTGIKVGLGVAGAVAIAALVDDDDDSSSEVSDPPVTSPPPTDPPVTDPPMGMLSVTPASISLVREVGDPCPVEVGVLSVNNDGDGSLDYTVSPTASSSSRFDYDDQGNSVSANSSDDLPVDFTCDDGDVEGTVSQEISFDAGDAGSDSATVEVTTNAAPVESGFLSNTGPTEFVKIHVVGLDPCPDPFGTIRITNTGGQTISFSLEGLPFAVSEVSDGSLSPGDSIEISVVFPCSGFSVGSNVGQIVIMSRDISDGSIDTGTVTIPVDLTVNE